MSVFWAHNKENFLISPRFGPGLRRCLFFHLFYKPKLVANFKTDLS